MKLITCPICKKVVDAYVVDGILTMFRGDGRLHSCGRDKKELEKKKCLKN